MDENPREPIDATVTRDVVDSGDMEALRFEILRLRDAVAGAATHEAILDDRVRELEQQVEDLAEEIRRLSRLTSNPAVRALLAASRPARHYFERRRARP